MDEKFKALGHENRLTIYRAISHEPLCVCEINELLDMSQPAVSQHLSKLQNARLIESDRRGQWTFYRPVGDSFGKTLDDLIGDPPDDLIEAIEQIKYDDICKIRTDNGKLPEET